jgi:hypothetical protein
MSLLNGTAGPDGAVDLAGQALPVHSAAGASLTIGIRPEQLKPVAEGASRLQAYIDFTEYLGGTDYVFCVLDDDQQLVAECEPGEGGALRVGDRIGQHIKEDRLHLFDAAGPRMEQGQVAAACRHESPVRARLTFRTDWQKSMGCHRTGRAGPSAFQRRQAGKSVASLWSP